MRTLSFVVCGLVGAGCGSVVPTMAGHDDAGPADAAFDGPPVCATPPGWPSTRSWINLRADTDGRAGADLACARVGSSSAATNPQYVWCRRWGGEVRGSNGSFNHWWLWTDLDTGGDAGGRGWISAFYISGQGDDQADDINTHQAIPACP